MGVPLVRDYMSQKRERVDPQDAVISAIELMVERDVGSVLVVDKDERLVGIFTERDLLRHYLEAQSKFLYLTVEQVMTSPVLTVPPSMPLSDALALMAEKDVRHLPVVDKQGKVVGYLTWKNLFQRFSAMVREGSLTRPD
ncbi:MAG: CBS domain-containing protein [Methanomassiliicoccales archaeon]|nr:CBS domain-containing protein [Methanomassiliicoccales archaeon]